MRTQRRLDEMRVQAQENVQRRIRTYYRRYFEDRVEIPDDDEQEMMQEAEDAKETDLYRQSGR